MNAIEQIEITEQSAKAKVELGRALNKLVGNREFKKLILEEYFEKEAARLVMLKAEPNMQDDESQKRIIKDIDAIGNLRQYFRAIEQLSMMAEKSLKDCAEHREYLAQENDDEV
jgi:hypothetical protein